MRYRFTITTRCGEEFPDNVHYPHSDCSLSEATARIRRHWNSLVQDENRVETIECTGAE